MTIKASYKTNRKRFFRKITLLVASPVWLGLFISIQILRPWLLIRVSPLISERLGHFAANTELYLCEKESEINMPKKKFIDLFYFGGTISNKQLAKMWCRCLKVWPSWLLAPVNRLNKLLPHYSEHDVGNNGQGDRDIYDLLKNFSPHLSFTKEEELRGKNALVEMGIPESAEFICLIARDSFYLKAESPANMDHHNYRNVDINNYVLAAEELAERGYYVLRMGSIVKSPINSSHPKVIDYAWDGMRTDFMDIYLGAKCLFCLTSGTGYDAIPVIFRRPIAFVNHAPIGYIHTYLKEAVGISKRYWLPTEDRWLTLREIFLGDIGYCLSASCFKKRNIEVVENTPEEILSVVIEMVERLKNIWISTRNDEILQKKYWDIFPSDIKDEINLNSLQSMHKSSQVKGNPLHGKINARYGAQFLRDNPTWLE
ncbi:TIGR04372 family glycosyltransferase [bacterium]|nr:TIGR04372 family glycosyltransferase [bacterium]